MICFTWPRWHDYRCPGLSCRVPVPHLQCGNVAVMSPLPDSLPSLKYTSHGDAKPKLRTPMIYRWPVLPVLRSVRGNFRAVIVVLLCACLLRGSELAWREDAYITAVRGRKGVISNHKGPWNNGQEFKVPVLKCPFLLNGKGKKIFGSAMGIKVWNVTKCFWLKILSF